MYLRTNPALIYNFDGYCVDTCRRAAIFLQTSKQDQPPTRLTLYRMSEKQTLHLTKILREVVGTCPLEALRQVGTVPI